MPASGLARLCRDLSAGAQGMLVGRQQLGALDVPIELRAGALLADLGEAGMQVTVVEQAAHLGGEIAR